MDSRPAVLVLTTTLPAWPGDPEPRFVLDLARSVSPWVRPIILAPMSPGSASREVMDGVEVRRFRYAPLRAWERLATPGAILPNLKARPWLALLIPALLAAQCLAVLRLARTHRFDAVHAHWIVPQGLTAALCSLVARMPPTLVTCHGADAFTLNGPLLRRLKAWVLRRSAAVTVVSSEIGSFLVTRVENRIANRVSQVPMGVDLQLFRRSASPTPSGWSHVLYAGRLSEKKGIDRLLRALASEALTSRNVTLRLVGDGPLRETLHRLSHELGISNRVTFVGPLAHDALVREMERASLFALPSVVARSGDREGTPTVLLEAAAMQLPIVASDIGGCRDLIVNGQSGWLVPPGDAGAIADAIAQAHDQPDMARAYAAESNRLVQEFSWDRVGRRYADEILRMTRAAASP